MIVFKYQYQIKVVAQNTKLAILSTRISNLGYLEPTVEEILITIMEEAFPRLFFLESFNVFTFRILKAIL